MGRRVGISIYINWFHVIINGWLNYTHAGVTELTLEFSLTRHTQTQVDTKLLSQFRWPVILEQNKTLVESGIEFV